MKWNWGYGIALAYTLFVAGMVGMVIKSTSYDHSLVADDYYAKDIAYQQQYDKMANTLALDEGLSIRLDQDGMVALNFPEQLGEVQGRIHFFCPSDSQRDFQLPVQTDSEFVQRVPAGQLKKGLWRIKVDWQAGGTAYYTEETLFL